MTNIDPRSSGGAGGSGTNESVVALPLLCPAGKWWLCTLIGVIFVVGGLFMLFNAVLASAVAAIFFGAAITVGGIFQIIHAFSSRGWGGLAVSLIIGVLLTLAGLLLMANPLATSIGLTLAFAALLIAGGVVRLVLAYQHWRDFGWILLLSGIVGIATGIVVYWGFPWSGLIVPGLLLGIDFIFHGAWWIVLGAFVRRPSAPSVHPTPRPAAAA